MEFAEFKEDEKIKFRVSDDRFKICKHKEIPIFSDKIFAIIKDKNEVTVIAQEELELTPIAEEKSFKLITFNIALPFNLSGFIAYISSLLAKENISIFVISAYTTDHLFIKEKDLDKTMEILQRNGLISL